MSDTEVRDHFVYRLFDADDRLLYVGCTKRLTKRYAEHRTERRAMIAATQRIRLQGPFSRATARAIEKEAIRTELPFIGWTPEKHRIECQRTRWVNERTRELTGNGTDVYAAIHQACDEVDAAIPNPYAAESAFLGHGLASIRA